jgi:hypothetical protein
MLAFLYVAEPVDGQMAIRPASKSLLVIALLLTYVLTSYNASIFPLRSLLGSLLIVWTGRAIWPTAWKDRLGLRFRGRDVALAMLMALPPDPWQFRHSGLRRTGCAHMRTASAISLGMIFYEIRVLVAGKGRFGRSLRGAFFATKQSPGPRGMWRYC